MRCARQLRSLFRTPEPLGQLVEPGIRDAPIVRNIASSEPEQYSRRNKFHIETLKAKSPSPGMASLPADLSSEISTMTWQWPPQLLRRRVAEMYGELRKGVSHQPTFESIDVEAHITGFFLQNFVSVRSALLEVQKRRPNFQPKTVLDIGFGPATGLLAARDVFAPADADSPSPCSGSDSDSGEKLESLAHGRREVAVIIGHPRMKRRAKQLMKNSDNVVFKDNVPSPNSPTKYDLIITTHQLFQSGPLAEQIVDGHTQQLAQQLTPNGVIVFVERGDPVGFESVALAREHLLRPKYGFNVVGPCQHQRKCPLQAGLETRLFAGKPASQNWCRFTQNVQRPLFATELKKGQYLSQEWVPESTRGRGGKGLKGTGRSNANANEIAHFSWVALENAAPPATETEASLWPRVLKQPLKRDGHVTMEVCAPSGNVEHWTVTRSQGKQEYHDARKTNEMDLWALNAKVKQVRGGLTSLKKLQSQKPPADKLRTKAQHKDWWADGSTPHRKHASHQARVHAENIVEPEGFIPVMETLLAEDESRALKIERREAQSKYRG